MIEDSAQVLSTVLKCKREKWFKDTLVVNVSLLISNNITDSMSKDLLQNLNATMGTKTTRRQSRISDTRVNITRILLTGGPCAGKTTALAAISQDLTQLGYKVLVVPEAATLIMKGGAMIVSSEFKRL
jgi:signal recognition particle GTPase